MILTIEDFTQTQEFYRIPQPTGPADTADLVGALSEGERQFMETFRVVETEIIDERLEALKYFAFAFWLRWQATRKTPSGAGAKINFTQSQNYIDEPRRYQAYNRACFIMGRPDLKMFKILNH